MAKRHFPSDLLRCASDWALRFHSLQRSEQIDLYRSLMRKTVDHMMTYDDARHFGVARGILRPFEHDDPRNVQHV